MREKLYRSVPNSIQQIVGNVESAMLAERKTCWDLYILIYIPFPFNVSYNFETHGHFVIELQ